MRRIIFKKSREEKLIKKFSELAKYSFSVLDLTVEATENQKLKNYTQVIEKIYGKSLPPTPLYRSIRASETGKEIMEESSDEIQEVLRKLQSVEIKALLAHGTLGTSMAYLLLMEGLRDKSQDLRKLKEEVSTFYSEINKHVEREIEGIGIKEVIILGIMLECTRRFLKKYHDYLEELTEEVEAYCQKIEAYRRKSYLLDLFSHFLSHSKSQ